MHDFCERQRQERAAAAQREALLRRIGRQIVGLREDRGWDRARLARELGVRKQRLGRWERGERPPSLAILDRLRTMFGITIHELDLPEPIEATEFAKGDLE